MLDQSRFYVESPHHDILDSLMADDVIKVRGGTGTAGAAAASPR